MFPSIPITPFGLLIAFGFVLASFVFWRGLKNDFSDEEIFGLTSWLGLLGLLVGRVGYAIFNFQLFLQNPASLFLWTKYFGFSLLGVMLGMIGALLVWAKRGKRDIWQVLDVLVTSGLAMFIFGSLGAYLSKAKSSSAYFVLESSSAYLGNKEFIYLGFGLAGFLVLILQKFYLSKYRSFRFYPSGKVGFLGLSSVILLLVFILPLDFYKNDGLSLEAIGYLAMIVVTGGFLYLRSERRGTKKQ